MSPIAVPGGYRLGHRVRSGDGAEIFEAAHPRIPGRYAVKILAPSLARDAKAVRAFRADAELTAALRHPNIVQVFDINQLPDGRPFLVMEFLEGQDLESRLAGNAALPLHETLSIVRSVAAGLQAAHVRGVVHRDLRPENVFLVPVEGHDTGFVKILNFGMSNLRVGAGNVVHFVGTPHYMAPEQALGRLDEIDPRTDQFALAAMAFRMLSGIQAFRGDDALGVMYQIAHERPRGLSLRTLCPPGVEIVLHKALAKNKAERYDSVVAFARDLDVAAAGGQPSVSAAPTPLMGVPQTTPVLERPAPGMAQRSARIDDELAVPLEEATGPGHEFGLSPGVLAAADLDEEYAPPRKRGGPIVFGFVVLLGVAATSVFLFGAQFPESWRRSDLWLRFNLPHAVRAQEPAPAAVAPAAPKPEVAPVAAVEVAATDAGAATEAIPATAPGVAPAPAPAAEAAPPVVEPTPQANTPAAPPPPVAPAHEERVPRRRAHRSGEPSPARNYIWSDREGRLVPIDGKGVDLLVVPGR